MCGDERIGLAEARDPVGIDVVGCVVSQDDTCVVEARDGLVSVA